MDFPKRQFRLPSKEKKFLSDKFGHACSNLLASTSRVSVADCGINLAVSSSFIPSCPVCGVDLVNFNELECDKHVVRCLNATENKSFESTVPEKILCPCCEKISLPPSDLERHVQHCGVEILPSSTAQSFAASVASSYSSSVASTLGGTMGKRKKQTCITMKALKKMDEETQVALALSASMQPVDLARNQRAVAKSSKRKMKFVPPPPVLIERDPEDSTKIVADRVAFLVGKTRTASLTQPILPESKLQSRKLSERNEEENEGDSVQTESLWNLSEKLLTKNSASFYVSSLVPPISPLKHDVDAHFRSLSQIPGFRLQFDATQKRPFFPVKSEERSSALPNTVGNLPESLTCLDSDKNLESSVTPSSCTQVPALLCSNASGEIGEVLAEQPPKLPWCTDLENNLLPTAKTNPTELSSFIVEKEDQIEIDDDREDACTLILFSSSEEELEDSDQEFDGKTL